MTRVRPGQRVLALVGWGGYATMVAAPERRVFAIPDAMTFEGTKGPPFKVEGKEGYYLTKDGGLGDYFIETHGQVHRLAKLGAGVGGMFLKSLSSFE